jgi:hypothetical protein
MKKRNDFVIYIISTLVALLLISAAAFMAYRVGFNQGALAGENINWQQIPEPGVNRGIFFPGVGIINVLIALLFFGLVVGMLRRIFFFPHWRYCGPHGFHRHMSEKEWRYMHHPFWDAWVVDEDEPGEDEAKQEKDKK